MTSFRFIAAAVTVGLFAVVAACDSSDDSGGAPPPGGDASPDGQVERSDAGAGDGSTDPDDGGDGGPVASAAGDVCPDAAKKVCAFLSTCNPDIVAGLWASASECEPRFRDNCLAAYPPNAKVRKDDADAYATCLGKLACDDLYGPRWTTGCATPRLVTTKANGQPCRSDFECDSRACTGSSTTCGTCVVRKKAGDSCSDSRECPEGGYCNEKCYAPAFLGDSCDAFNVCGNGLGCESGKCVKIGAVGADCDSDLDCDIANLVQCNRGAGKCEKLTFLDPGDTCPAAFDQGPPAACTKGSSCIRPAMEAGMCVTNAKVGEACNENVRCEQFINCRNGQCVLPTYVPCP